MQVKWGRLALKTLALYAVPGGKPGKVTATLAGRPVATRVAAEAGDRALITFVAEITVAAGQELVVQL